MPGIERSGKDIWLLKPRYKTFKGGVRLPHDKELTSSGIIYRAPVPARVMIPLTQHIGAPNSPLVSPGDRVRIGQKVGESDSYVSAPVHSPVTGTVRAIEDITGFTGGSVRSLVIEADADQPEFEAERTKPLARLSGDDIRRISREAGLVGLGGAAFPTHVKISPSRDKPIDTVIINGCECEPFLTCDHRLMLERPRELIEGIKLLMRAVGAQRGIVGIEADKADAVEQVRFAASAEVEIDADILDVKYPEGSEKQLISVLTGRRIPPGELPSVAGCLVQNVGTAIALYDAAATGKPLYERVLTVSGHGINNPGNFLVMVGTPVGFLLDVAGGIKGEPYRLVVGGPMTGWAQESVTAPVVKGTSGVLVLPQYRADMREEQACVRCAKCVDACPMFLMPNFIVDAVQNDNWPRARMWGALDCYECGCCSYTCPANIPHVGYVRRAKAEIAGLKR